MLIEYNYKFINYNIFSVEIWRVNDWLTFPKDLLLCDDAPADIWHSVFRSLQGTQTSPNVWTSLSTVKKKKKKIQRDRKAKNYILIEDKRDERKIKLYVYFVDSFHLLNITKLSKESQCSNLTHLVVLTIKSTVINVILS